MVAANAIFAKTCGVSGGLRGDGRYDAVRSDRGVAEAVGGRGGRSVTRSHRRSAIKRRLFLEQALIADS